MSLQGTAAHWKSRSVRKLLAPLPVILLIVSACATVSPGMGPSESQGFRYNHRLFTIELKNVEVFDDEVKITLMYTNRTDRPAFGQVLQRAFAGQDSYLVDNRGTRYRYKANSFGGVRDFPPRIPEEIWISFDKLQPGASSINLVLSWRAGVRVYPGDAETVTITFRRIALPSATGTPGFRYNHRLFTMELKNVQVVGDEVKVDLKYTNQGSSAQFAGIAEEAYLIDNLGKRYQYARDSFGRSRRDFPPQAAEEIWITFGKLQPGASSVNLVLPWRAGGEPAVTVTFRDIPLYRALEGHPSGTLSSRQCTGNFKEEGTGDGGRLFSTFAVSSNASRDTVYPRLLRAIEAARYEVTVADSARGIIRGLNPPTPSGQRAILDAGVEQFEGAGVRVRLAFTLPPLTTAPVDAVRDEFCMLVSAALPGA